jgi:hypothetical protein
MSIDLSALHSLPDSEKLRIVELLWDDLGRSSEPIPLPDWVDHEAMRRRDEMRDSSTVRYHPMLECDIRKAAGWHDRRSAGLGDAFVDLARQCVGEVIEDPERFGLSPAGVRYNRVPRFPYVVLFDLVDDEILMLGVLHTARSMEKWREREGGAIEPDPGFARH